MLFYSWCCLVAWYGLYWQKLSSPVICVHKDFFLSGYWSNKFQYHLQAGAQSLIKVCVVHEEGDAVSEMHCVSLCNFVHLSVLRSKKPIKIFGELHHSSQHKMCCHAQGVQTGFFYLVKFLCNTVNTFQINISKAEIHHSARSTQSCSLMNKLKNIKRKPKKFYRLQ